MDTSTSSSIKLKKQIDTLSEFNLDSSQNVSDLLGSLSIFSNQSSPQFSTPTASAFEEGDEHLLDFLNSSHENFSNIDNSLISSDLNANIDFTPPKISRKRSHVKNKKKSIQTKENNAFEFIDTFNDKFGLKATKLDDVISYIESMKDENKESDETSSISSKTDYQFANCEIQSNKFTDQQVRIAQLQIERDNLQTQLSESEIQIKELQAQISNRNISNNTIIESNKSLQRDITNLQNSINSLHEIIEQQLADISILSEQRSKLIEVTKKQESIIQIYDSLCKSDKNNLNILQKQSKKAKNDMENQVNLNKQQEKIESEKKNDFYTIMCSIVHSADNFLSNKNDGAESPTLKKIHQIRDNSEKEPRERILLITKSLISSLSECREKNVNNEELIQQQTETIDKYKRKCRDILSMFEEELNFLQTITHSNELQAAIFSNPKRSEPIILDDECKSELIRQCAVLGRFIEETVGSISSDSFYNSFEGNENLDSSNIFQLLQKSSMEKKMANIFNKIEDPDNVDTRQIFDLLAAQIFMNETLKNYASELQVRLSQNTHELLFLRQENENLSKPKNHQDSKLSFQKQQKQFDDDSEIKQQNKTLQKLVKSYQKRENKLKRYASNFLEFDDESNIVDATISLISQMNEQLLQQQSLSAQIVPSSPSIEESRLKDELIQCQAEIKELEKQLKEEKLQKEKINIDEINEEFKKKTDALNEKIVNYENQSKSYENEIQNLKKQISEKEKQIEVINKEQKDKQAQYDISLDEAKNKLESSIRTIKSLTQEIQQYETVLGRAKKQRPKLMKEIERLTHINQHLTETITKQNNKIKNEYDLKINKLLKDFENIKKEKELIESKNEQLSSEISSYLLEKKSTELKIQNYDKRVELEKQNLITQINAQNNSIQVEQEQKINSLNQAIEGTINKLSELLTDDFTMSNQLSLSENLKLILTSIEVEVKKMKNVQSLYVDLLDDVTQARKLLKVGNSAKISESVSELLHIQDSQNNSNSDFQKMLKQDRIEIDKLKRAINKLESQSASLKHWENWAKRLYRVLHESNPQRLNSDDLRLSLEEALLASVSHRSTLLKIQSLRSQKAALLKFDGRLLFKPVINGNKVSLHSLIAISIFIRRAQFLARCLPISVRNNEFQLLNDRTNRQENVNMNNEHFSDKHDSKTMIRPRNLPFSNERKLNLINS